MSDWQENPRRSLWQHPVWGDFQEAIGRKVWRLEAGGASAIIIKHPLPFDLCWLEVPRGPLFTDEKDLSEILSKIRELGKRQKAVFVRMSSYDPDFTFKKPRLSFNDHHPQTSLVIDLDGDKEEIRKQMKQKGRYNIKVAQKHDVKVASSIDLDSFYGLLEKTGGRDGFGIHPKSYYENLLDSIPDNAHLLLATHNGDVIAGGIFIFLDEWGIYYYGASDHGYRKYMAPYLLQWEAIKRAKENGCKYYDFLGIAPEGAKNHPWSGVTEFKMKFGGRVVNYPQAKEMVLRPVWYFLYSIYKKVKA